MTEFVLITLISLIAVGLSKIGPAMTHAEKVSTESFNAQFNAAIIEEAKRQRSENAD